MILSAARLKDNPLQENWASNTMKNYERFSRKNSEEINHYKQYTLMQRTWNLELCVGSYVETDPEEIAQKSIFQMIWLGFLYKEKLAKFSSCKKACMGSGPLLSVFFSGCNVKLETSACRPGLGQVVTAISSSAVQTQRLHLSLGYGLGKSIPTQTCCNSGRGHPCSCRDTTR